MTSVLTNPPWRPRWKLSGSRMKNVLPQWNLWRKMLQTSGIALALLLMLAVLSGCSTTVVREKCPPYPLAPLNLMQPPLNKDLIPKSSLPSSSAKTGLQTQ